jgi:hypothetical protein
MIQLNALTGIAQSSTNSAGYYRYEYLQEFVAFDGRSPVRKQRATACRLIFYDAGLLRSWILFPNPTDFGTHTPLPTSSVKPIGVKASKLRKQRAAAVAQAFYAVDFCFRTLSISELMPLPTSSAKRIIRTSKYDEGTQQRQSISLRMIEQITKRTNDANDSTNQAMGSVS